MYKDGKVVAEFFKNLSETLKGALNTFLRLLLIYSNRTNPWTKAMPFTKGNSTSNGS